VNFVLQHAGMLEDPEPGRAATWRAGDGRPRRPAQRLLQALGLRHLRAPQRPGTDRLALAETVALFGADRCLWGSNFPIEKLWTDYAALLDAHRDAAAALTEPARRDLSRHRKPGLPAVTGRNLMALEIKILDYGDIELESSFLVLGRDCGRVRRVPVYGFLILGGQYPVVVDTGYRDNAIMETLGMRGLQFHENMIERQLAKHGVKVGDVRYILHTHLHIDHAGKDDHFPMNTTVVINRRELEYSVSGLMHPQYPKPDIIHLVERLHTPGALRLEDLEISGRSS
jgi:hypothetical protein